MAVILPNIIFINNQEITIYHSSFIRQTSTLVCPPGYEWLIDDTYHYIYIRTHIDWSQLCESYHESCTNEDVFIRGNNERLVGWWIISVRLPTYYTISVCLRMHTCHACMHTHMFILCVVLCISYQHSCQSTTIIIEYRAVHPPFVHPPVWWKRVHQVGLITCTREHSFFLVLLCFFLHINFIYSSSQWLRCLSMFSSTSRLSSRTWPAGTAKIAATAMPSTD